MRAWTATTETTTECSKATVIEGIDTVRSASNTMEKAEAVFRLCLAIITASLLKMDIGRQRSGDSQWHGPDLRREVGRRTGGPRVPATKAVALRRCRSGLWISVSKPARLAR